MKLEAVGRVTVGDLRLQVGGQVDDMNCAKRTFLRADTATDTQPFRYKRDFGVRRNFDAKLAGTNNRTRLFTFLTTFLHSRLLGRYL